MLLSVLTAAVTSCKKLVTVDLPADQLTTASVFTDDESATAAVRGIYSEIMRNNNYIGNGALSVYPGLTADEIIRTSASTTEDAFATNSISITSSVLLTNLWQKGYFHIYQANAVLENLAGAAGVSDGTKNQLAGEAKFMRAFFHFYLTNLFGAVPVVTTTDYTTNAVVQRADSSAVYRQIIRDLTEAQSQLAPAYSSAERARANKWAAAALLARVYLYLGDWANAENTAGTVIGSGSYQLAGVNSAFLPSSTETILQFLPAITQIFNTSEAFSFLPASATARPTYKLTDYLLNAFEAADLRKGAWTKTVTISGVTYTYPYKYKTRTGTAGAAKSEYNVVLRLAEMYLIRAEARAHQGNLAGAQTDLNTIRTRAGVGNAVAADKAAVLAAVEKERQTEFFCEWGHRWCDLKRTGRADAVLGIRKAPTWQATDALFPVPQNEILLNPQLTQNPGY